MWRLQLVEIWNALLNLKFVFFSIILTLFTNTQICVKHCNILQTLATFSCNRVSRYRNYIVYFFGGHIWYINLGELGDKLLSELFQNQCYPSHISTSSSPLVAILIPKPCSAALPPSHAHGNLISPITSLDILPPVPTEKPYSTLVYHDYLLNNLDIIVSWY